MTLSRHWGPPHPCRSSDQGRRRDVRRGTVAVGRSLLPMRCWPSRLVDGNETEHKRREGTMQRLRPKRGDAPRPAPPPPPPGPPHLLFPPHVGPSSRPPRPPHAPMPAAPPRRAPPP